MMARVLTAVRRLIHVDEPDPQPLAEVRAKVAEAEATAADVEKRLAVYKTAPDPIKALLADLGRKLPNGSGH